MFMVCQLCMEPLLCYMGIELWIWSLMLLLSRKSYTRQEVRLRLYNLANAFTEKAQVMVLWGRSKWYHDRQWFEEWTRLLKRRQPARLLWGNDIQADVVVLKCSLQILAYSSHIKRGSLCPCPLPLESRLSADKQHKAKVTPCHFQGWGLKETARFSFLSRWGCLLWEQGHAALCEPSALERQIYIVISSHRSLPKVESTSVIDLNPFLTQNPT